MLSQDGHIFVAEQTVIREFARRGRCIFVVHCAAEALRDQPRVARVFIRCNANTGKKWSDLKNYDIVLDSGIVGIDGCVAVLKGLF